ncbi:MAG: glycosyltransferase [Candidatus Aegiribacteria sp.]|nr:glycosyltransferase [Candidatus Aegiribacteria sp.]MBD3294887.1 glycosyltransferase [Candidatus Fermentibacteria bacterium]
MPDVILFLLAVLFWLLGFAVFFRVLKCRETKELPGQVPNISVIIPARNEEENLPVLLDSLSKQDVAVHETVVVDDSSTDGTAGSARAFGAKVVSSEPLPRGWTGKTWACHQGAVSSSGELLVFLDADLSLEEDGLRRIVSTFLSGEGVLSVLPYHSVRKLYENLSAYFNLLMAMGTGAFTFLGERLQPAGLFGQSLVLDRESYFRAGGHKAVREHILENFHMARIFRKLAIPMKCRRGKGVLNMRMYPSGFYDLTEGWSKAFASGAAGVPLPVLMLSVVWISGSIIALCMLVLYFAGYSHAHWLWPAAYPLFSLQTGLWFRKLGSFHVLSWLVYPVPLMFFLYIMLKSLVRKIRGKNVTWRGRSMPIPSSGSGTDNAG